MRDFRQALTQLRRSPGFVALCVSTLALGIGITTAIYSAAYQLLIAPLPYASPDRVVLVLRTLPGSDVSTEPKADVAQAIVSRAHVFESAALFSRASFTLSSQSGPEVLDGARIAANLLHTVGMSPVAGRGFASDDTLAGAPDVVLISYGLWQTRFSGSTQVLGKVIRVDDHQAAIVGVMPPEFTLPWTNGDQLWMPLRAPSAQASVNVIALLRRGITPDLATRELRPIATSVEAQSATPSLNAGTTVMLASSFFGDRLERSGLRTALIALFAAVTALLLIACANAANIQLARAWARQREFALRLAIGASRMQIVRLVLAESVFIACLGSALGLFLAWRGLALIVALRPPALSELAAVHLNGRVLVVSMLVSVVTVVALVLMPALAASDTHAVVALRTNTPVGPAGLAPRRVRAALIVGEVALSVVLLVAAGLLVRSLIALNRFNPGIDPNGLTSVVLDLPRDRFVDAPARAAVDSRILEQVRSIPGVQGASLALVLPPSSAVWAGGDLEVDGQPGTAAERKPVFGMNLVTPDFFTTIGLRLQSGRLFDAAPNDSNSKRPRDVIVSESFARRELGGGNVLGKRFHAASGGGPWMTVVGTVGDVRLPGKYDVVAHTQVYQPLPYGFPQAKLIVRSAEPLRTLAGKLMAAIRDADGNVRVRRMTTARLSLDDAMALPRFLTALLGSFAALAFVTALVGLYGVIAVSVTQRLRELGVRMALGAEPRQVLRLVVGDGIRLALIGLVFGISISLLVTRALRSLLIGVEPIDPTTLAAVAGSLLVAAIAASYVPARRAARTDPLVVLRSE